MNNAFGLSHLWGGGDAVTRVTFAVLLAMSALSWTVMLIKTLDLWRVWRQARRVPRFWEAATPAEGLERLLPASGNPFRALAEEGAAAAQQQRALAVRAAEGNPDDWIARALHGVIAAAGARLQSGLVVLASVGSTAPFVGLFGTVWGIYHALVGLSAGGQAAGIGQVAGPIGEALIMTAFGLAAAIPAVLGYNALLRGNKALLVRLGRFAYELHRHHALGAACAGPIAEPVPLAKAA